MDNLMLEMKPRRNGDLNKDKRIYYIELGNGAEGFFAVYRYLLEFLYLSDICEMIPVIKYNEDFIYTEKREINGTDNPFEYYFLQPSDISVEDVNKSFCVTNSSMSDSYMVRFILTGSYNSYKTTDVYLNLLAKIQRKYIRLQPIVKEFIDNSIQKIIGYKKVLGVHIRGTDFKKNYNDHPIYVTEELYINKIEEQLKLGKWDKVFLATDDKKILEKVKNRFGEKIIYYSDVCRADNNVSVAFSQEQRNNHKYMLGLEVLRDAYTLAMCDGLIAGISQVSICARIVKISNGENYSYTDIIENGYNHNGRKFIRIYEKETKEKTELSLNYNEQNKKFLSMMLLFNQWMIIKQKGKSVKEYLKRKGIKKIAIYGMGYVGERLYDELKDSEIEIKYAIDKNANLKKSELNIITPEETYENVDAIIVTPIFYFESIENILKKKTEAIILSFEDILYDV